MKKSFTTYQLHFTTPVHFGDEREDYGHSHMNLKSDALYAAILASLAKVGVKVPDDGDIGVTISSLFPFMCLEENMHSVYFLPKPKSRDLPDDEAMLQAKQAKKIDWLDAQCFSEFIHGKSLFALLKNNHIIHDAFLSSHFHPTAKLLNRQVYARVAVPRVQEIEGEKQLPTPFYTERIFFEKNAGLYFIADGEEKSLQTLEMALNVLKDEGLGTDRNVGNGFFEWKKDVLQLDLPESKYVMALGVFLPESKEQLKALLHSDKSAYRFHRRGGWITDSSFQTFRKNSIYMFSEGSVFSSNSVENVVTMGRIVNLKPDSVNVDHGIFRNGKTLFLPIKLN